ncbi:MAG: L,D-transpeptidase family protein, partial [Clostridia bacterium]|nr:L,D-transpeptidase family protein [Clostridia bacterium]
EADDNLSNTSKAKLYCYEKNKDGYWWNVAGEGKTVTDEVYIGENGSAYEVTADSKKTPAGMWLLGEGFYIGQKPDTTYPTFEITEDTYWVTDTESAFFNQKVDGAEEKDWTKAEHMIAAPKSYKYGLVISYNTYEPDTEKPSAIFMHCGNTPTEGCIAVPENVMKAVLEWLDGDCAPFIWITV